MVATTDVAEACKDVNIAVMVGGFPRKEGMERKDVMSKNVSIYKAQASALEQYAAKNVKVGPLKEHKDALDVTFNAVLCRNVCLLFTDSGFPVRFCSLFAKT